MEKRQSIIATDAKIREKSSFIADLKSMIDGLLELHPEVRVETSKVAFLLVAIEDTSTEELKGQRLNLGVCVGKNDLVIGSIAGTMKDKPIIGDLIKAAVIKYELFGDTMKMGETFHYESRRE